MKKIAVLHHNDADGFGAAFAAWYGLYLTLPPDQVRPEMKFIPVQYGQEPPVEELAAFGPDEVYIVDFSYKRDVLFALKDAYPHIMVIDHHKTAEADLQGLGFCFFDQTRSGCALAWQVFCKDLPMPAILGYVEDRDLWKFALPESKAVNAYIATLEWDFQVWLEFNIGIALAAGNAVLAFQKKQIEGRVKGAVLTSVFPPFPRETDDYEYAPARKGIDYFDIPTVNASENISELGDALGEAYPDAPFTMSYCDRQDGKRSYSLRSRNGFDVSVVAKAFGGGGHAAAAGFTLDAPEVI